MPTTLPSFPNLPEGCHLNVLIAAINKGPQIDEVFTASQVAAIIRYLQERPSISGAQEWISQTETLTKGVDLHQPTLENFYADIVQSENSELGSRKGCNPFALLFFAGFLAG